MAYTCACYPRPDACWRRRRTTSSTSSAASSACAPECACSMSGAAGAAWSATPSRTMACGRSVSRSAPHRRHTARRGSREGLGDRAEIRHGDYREITESGFDAVSSIGLTEHIGIRNYPGYFAFLAERLRDGGLLLNHCITRPNRTFNRIARAGSSTATSSPTANSPPSESSSAPWPTRVRSPARRGPAGALRQNLPCLGPQPLRQLGRRGRRGRSRHGAGVGLYLSGSSLGFERNEIQLHQVLGQKVGPRGAASHPLRPEFT